MLLDPPNFRRLEHLADILAECILAPMDGEEFIDLAVRVRNLQPRHSGNSASNHMGRAATKSILRSRSACLAKRTRRGPIGTLLRLPSPLQAGYASLTRPTLNRVNPTVPP